MDIKCPYCNSEDTTYIDILDENLESYSCCECDEYFYVEFCKGDVVDVRITKWEKN